MRARARSRPRGGTHEDERREAVPSTAQTNLHTRVLGLQAAAGNTAVSGLLQRQPQAVWSDADPAVDPAVNWSWNKAAHFIGPIGRYPLQGLTEGNQGEWKSGASAQLSKEGAKGTAIAYVHKDIKADKPVTLVVHLHGYTESAKSRPYAGWRQHKRTHKVRDVEHDRVANQLDAAGDPQIIVVLPQGGEESQFGKDPKNPYNTFSSDDYVKTVLAELKRVNGVKAVPTTVKVVISAHSGGGHTVGSMLAAENEKRKGAKVGDHSSAPSSLGGLMLFDAMTWGELKTVKEWVRGELSKLLAALTAAAPANRQKLIDDAPRFRGYYTLGESYVLKYQDLDGAIRQWFVDNDAALAALGPGWADKIWPLFQVIPWGGKPGETHETIVRGTPLNVTQATGNLSDALKAIKNPTALTARPAPPPPKPKPAPKPRSSSRTRAKARSR